jgi:hypothetical protein
MSDDFVLPPKIDPFIYSVPKGVHYSYSEPYNNIYGFPNIRIWGWASDGKVAYSSEHMVEGRGGIEIQYCIFDFITDEIISTINIDSFSYNIDETGDELIFSLYNIKKEEIIELMVIHSIIKSQAPFLPFPIQKGNNRYNYYLDIEYEETPEFYDAIKNYSIIIESNRKRKTIKTINNVTALSIYCCGYFMSPFESRALIVLAEEQWGFEGVELVYFFSGCNLNVGFN